MFAAWMSSLMPNGADSGVDYDCVPKAAAAHVAHILYHMT